MLMGLPGLPEVPGPLGLLQQRNALAGELLIAGGQQAGFSMAHGLHQGMAPSRHHRNAAGTELRGGQAERFIAATGVHHPHRH